tara:strand:- start:1445 stop:2071 length:627 start_codon:yes stop_codon:yes gene_type:complete
MRSIKLFPVVVYQSEVKNNSELKELLVPKILEASNSLEIPEGWATTSIKTSWSGEPKGKEVISQYRDELYNSYRKCFDEFIDRKYELEVGNIWYNLYDQNSYQELHDHITPPEYLKTPDHFSCIHFLSYDEECHTSPEFRDPISSIRGICFDSDYISEYAELNIKEGDFLMFPTYLAHRVIPQKVSDIPRITISFNIKLTRYGNVIAS